MSYVDYFEEGYKHRIGNIELRKSQSLRDVYYMEVVQYYPNSYYGKEKDYIWDDVNHCYYPKGYENCHISKGCFKNPESCMTISMFRQITDEEPDVVSVGSRIANLSDEDWKNYKKILEFFYQMYYHNQEGED